MQMNNNQLITLGAIRGQTVQLIPYFENVNTESFDAATHYTVLNVDTAANGVWLQARDGQLGQRALFLALECWVRHLHGGAVQVSSGLRAA
jgi:hypothetical protein